MSEPSEICVCFDFMLNLSDHGVAKLNSGDIFSVHIPVRKMHGRCAEAAEGEWQ